MAANRRALLLLLAIGLPTLPACVVSMRHPAQPVIEPDVETTQTSTPVKFAELIRAPGERVALHNRPPETTPDGFASAPNTSPSAPPTLRPVPSENVNPTGSNTPPPPPAPLPMTIQPPLPLPDPPLVAALRAYLENRPEQAIEHLKGLDRPNQELMLQLIPAVVRASQMNLVQASPVEVGVLVKELEAPTAALTARSPLLVEKALFCRSVKNFGRYEAFPDRYGFKPGSITGVYVELRNVRSEPISTSTDGDGFLTRLSCSLEVRDTAGNIVDLVDRNRKPVQRLHDVKQDFTRSPVRDYYVVFWLPVPSTPGSYTVTFEIQDPASGRAVSRTMPFRVQ